VPIVAACVVYAIVLFAPQVLNDGDTWSHIGVGRWIIAQRAEPWSDPFSFTFGGAPWQAHEWLSEVLMAAAYDAGGVSLLLVLTGAAAGLAVFLLARHLRLFLAPFPALIVLIFAAGCGASGLLARPHILALPALEAWVAGLVIARGRNTPPSPWLLPVMTLWANLHGGFAFGLALVPPLALEAVVADPVTRWRTALQWALFLAAAVGAAMLTPYGWHGLVLPVRLLGMRHLGDIGEWRGMDFSVPQPLEIALLALLYACLTRGVRIPPIRLLLLFGLLHMALQHSRHQMLAGIVGALLVAEPLATGLPAWPVPGRPRGEQRLAWAGLAMLTLGRLGHPAAVPDSIAMPAAALRAVPEALRSRPVLNDYAFGGALIFAGIRPFIDARVELYGDTGLAAYLDLLRPDEAALDDVLRRQGIDWTILTPGSPLMAAMDARAGWRRTYADHSAVVHVRSAAGQESSPALTGS
jgi:hypothetical protein